MARTKDSEHFIKVLKQQNGSSGNKTLKHELAWEDNKYWRVRDGLLDEGRIIVGRGRGGSVDLVTPKKEIEGSSKENALYNKLLAVFQNKWKPERRLSEFHIEITAHAGAKRTGGTWTRPDLTAMSVQTFRFIHGRHLDFWTFEVKKRGDHDVIGVLEAVAHRRCANRSYALFQISEEDGTSDEVLKRCIDEARRLEVGLITFIDPSDYDTWEVCVEAVRHEPNPELLNEFISTQLSSEGQELLQHWLK